MATKEIRADKAEADRLVAAEVARLEAYYKDEPSAQKPTGQLLTFVRMCYSRHRPLIERWGDWSKVISITEGVRSSKDVAEVINPLIHRWREGVKLKNKTLPPVPLMPSTSKDDDYGDPTLPGVTDLEAKFCHLFQCHLPLPSMSSPLYVSRNYSGPNAVLAYAPGCTVEIRKGQAVSRAVLSDVRKRFKDNPTYVAFWEALFEQLGIVWAAAKPAKFELSMAPSDFIRLGDVGEKNSCYALGGANEQAKLYLAQVPNSMCLLVQRDDGKYLGRAWGIFAPKAGALEISNFYITPKEQLLPGTRVAVQRALALETPLKVYVPGDSYYPEDRAGAEEETYDSPIDGLQDTHGYPNGDAVLLAGDNFEAAVEELNKGIKRFLKSNRDIVGGREDDDDDDDDDPWG